MRSVRIWEVEERKKTHLVRISKSVPTTGTSCLRVIALGVTRARSIRSTSVSQAILPDSEPRTRTRMRREGQAGRPVAGRSPRTIRDGERSRRGEPRAGCGRRRVHSLMTRFGLENCYSSSLDAWARMKRARERVRGGDALPGSIASFSLLSLFYRPPVLFPGPPSLPELSFYP
jgi:hypothetical protein